MSHLVNMRTLRLAGLLLLWPAAAPAQNVQTIVCRSGQVLRGMYADVKVNGGSCTLDGAIVFGSALVSSGGTLTAKGGTEVRGSVQVNSGGDINLPNVTVLGDVSLKDSGNVTIGATSTVGTLKVENSRDVAVSGSAAAILSTASRGISLSGARVFPGGVTMKFSSGSLKICGSEIGLNGDTEQEGSGGVNMIESKGDLLAVAGVSCAASRIQGSVSVEKGEGAVRLVGAALNGDLVVIEQVGEVEVDGSACNRCATVGDVKIEKSKGDITLKAVTTDSDTTIAENDGDVTIKLSSLGSDVAISRNGMVVIKKNSFSLEDVLISSNRGPVVIDRNCDMRLTVMENNNVRITNNNPTDAGVTCNPGFGFTDADVTKNTGGVLIENNTGEGLFCSDNAPPPAGAGNTITSSAGQCAGF